MVGRYVGYHTQDRGKDIGGIQSASHAGLNHGIIHSLGSKPFKSHYHCELKERGTITFISALLPFLHKAHHILLRNHLSIDAYPFAEIHKVRGGVERGLISGSLECSCYHMGSRSFPISSGYMNCFELFLRIAEEITQFSHSLKPRFISRRSHPRKHRELGEKEIKGFLIFCFFCISHIRIQINNI